MLERRYGHSAVVVQDGVLIFGGFENRSPSNTLIHVRAPLSNGHYEELTSSSSLLPPAIVFHSCVVFRDKVYVFGGLVNQIAVNTVYVFDGKSNWEVRETENTPKARFGHCAVVHKSQMIVCGGSSDKATCSWNSLNLETNCWTEMSFSGNEIYGRYHHTVSLVDDILVVYGGVSGSGEYEFVLSDLFIVDLTANHTRRIAVNSCGIQSVIDGRYGHTAIAEKMERSKVRLSVYGGRSKHSYYSQKSLAIIIDLERNNATVEQIVSSSEKLNYFGTVVQFRDELVFLGGIAFKPQFTSNVIHCLPDELIHLIFEYLDWSTICHLSSISKSLRLATISNDDQYWKSKYEQVVSKFDYTIVPRRQDPLLVKGCYKQHIIQLLSVYRTMGTTVPEIKDYIESSFDVVNNGVCNHAFIGLTALRLLFENLPDFESAMHTFGSCLPQLEDDAQTTYVKGAKAVVVGDRGVGKNWLLHCITWQTVKECFIPTIFNNQVQDISFYGVKYSISFWNTPGGQEYSGLRSLSYPSTNVFLMCFSVVDPISFRNIKRIWYPEITQSQPRAAMLLVGTKVGRRDDPETVNNLKLHNFEPISYNQGAALAKELGCVAYLETSSSKRLGIDNIPHSILYAATMHTLLNTETRRKKNREAKCRMS